MAHPVSYDFQGYLDNLGSDWLQDDPLLRAWVGDEDRDWLEPFGRYVANEFRWSADEVERVENRPRLKGKGPYDVDAQQVALPALTELSLSTLHGCGVWGSERSERARYGAIYLWNQNGEAGVTCSVACTDGLIRLLERFPDGFEEELEGLRSQRANRYRHGAQFVTEIQGGSDAATNAVQAKRDGDAYTLWGQKWFCSNLTADHWLVTARPEGAGGGHRGVALFLVDRDGGGYTVERLKDKLGTRALPTAEIRFHGAPARPVGPLDEGLKNMVSTVLVTSRIHNVVACAAFCRRAAREARGYAEFRTAFGKDLTEHPLTAASLQRVEAVADLTEAGAFATVDAWLAALADPGDEAKGAWARVLVSIAKAVACRRTPGVVYEAMMLFGGNGIEERFSALPRLWRDSAILETWEGPYTLLMMQAQNDLQRLGVAGRAEEFLQPLHDEAGALAEELEEILASPDDGNILRWPDWATRFYEAFEHQALARGPAP